MNDSLGCFLTYVRSLQLLKWKIIKKRANSLMRGWEYWLKKILDLIKILNIPLMAQVLLKVFMDLKSLVSINLYNPVLHNTAGHVPHTYVSSARIKFYMEENIVCCWRTRTRHTAEMALFLHTVINHLQVNRFYQLSDPLYDNIVRLI